MNKSNVTWTIIGNEFNKCPNAFKFWPRYRAIDGLPVKPKADSITSGRAGGIIKKAYRENGFRSVSDIIKAELKRSFSCGDSESFHRSNPFRYAYRGLIHPKGEEATCLQKQVDAAAWGTENKFLKRTFARQNVIKHKLLPSQPKHLVLTRILLINIENINQIICQCPEKHVRR